MRNKIDQYEKKLEEKVELEWLRLKNTAVTKGVEKISDGMQNSGLGKFEELLAKPQSIEIIKMLKNLI